MVKDWQSICSGATSEDLPPVFYTIASVLGAFGSVDVLINFLDIMYAGMIIPNVIGSV